MDSQVKAYVIAREEDNASSVVIVEVELLKEGEEEGLKGIGLTEGGEAVCHLIEVKMKHVLFI